MTMLSTADPAMTVSMKGMDTLFFSTAVLRTSSQVNASAIDWSDTPIAATECSLRFCVKTFETNITNNRISEHSREILAVRSPRSWVQLHGEFNDRLDLPEGHASDDLHYDSVNASIDRTDLMLGDQYNISQEAVYGIGSFFRDLLSVNLTTKNSEGGIDGRINGFYMKDRQSQPAIAAVLYNSSDLGATFEALAASMSNAIRVGGDDSLQHPGDDGRLVTKYRID